MSDLLSKLSSSDPAISRTNQTINPVTKVSDETNQTNQAINNGSTGIKSTSNTPVSSSLVSAISNTKTLVNSGSTIGRTKPTLPYDPVISDDPTKKIIPIISNPVITIPKPTVKPIKNVYGASVDIQNARSILGTYGYNYIQTDQPGFVMPTFTSKDIILGGIGTPGGIGDVDLNGAIRLAGADRNLTAQAVNNYKNPKKVYGTGADLINAKDILGDIGYNYIDTGASGFVIPAFTSNDIILGGTGTAGGIGDIDLNGAIRLGGADRDATAQSIRDYSIARNVYGTGADLTNAKNILGAYGYNYIDTGKSGFRMPIFTSNDIILGGTGTAGGIGNVDLNRAVRLAGANRDLTAQAILNYISPKNVYGTGADLANAKNTLGNIGYNYIDTGASGFSMPTFNSNDIILGGAGTVGGIGNVNLNGAIRLAGGDRDATAQAISNFAVSKNVYGAGVDLENAKALLGTTGYNYIETDFGGFQRPVSFTSNDIILGGTGATGGIGDVKLNGALRLAGANRNLTAQAINNYKSPKNVYGTGADLANAESILRHAGYNYIDTGASGFAMPTFNSNDIILGGTGTAGGIGNVNLNGAVRLAGANRDSTAQAIRNYAVSKNVYGTGADLTNAKNILGNVGYNFIDTGASGFIMPSFTSNDIILGGTGTAGGIGNVNLNGAVRLAGADRDATAQAIRDYAGIKTPSSSTPTGSSTTVLQQGSQGEAVKELQSNLTYLGYDTKGIDGDFGPNTYNAVIAFQKDYGLTQDGVVGSQTENAIELALSRKAPVQTDTDYLQMGSTGAAVSRLQSKLSALGYYKDSIDGTFGQNTYNAVKEFQSDFGLTVDGIAGPRTMRALNTALQEAGITDDPSGTISPSYLEIGDRGDTVRQLQSDLRYLGYDPKGIDGIYGQNTYNAVIAFQRDHNLNQDGIVGPATRNALSQAIESKQGPILTHDMINAGVTITTVNGKKYFDFSTPINKMINDNTALSKQHRAQDSVVTADSTGMAYLGELGASLVWFKEQVKPKGPWDLKEQNRWNTQLPALKDFNVTGANNKFVLNGKLMTAEALGNITYGYWGSAMGFGPELLYFGGGYATLHNFDDPRLYSASSFYGDHEDDHYNIEYGIKWYQKSFSNDKPTFNPSIDDLKNVDSIKKVVQNALIDGISLC